MITFQGQLRKPPEEYAIPLIHLVHRATAWLEGPHRNLCLDGDFSSRLISHPPSISPMALKGTNAPVDTEDVPLCGCSCSSQ